MEDMKGFEKDLGQLAKAVHAMQLRLNPKSGREGNNQPVVVPTDQNLFLMRRHQVLAALGMHKKVSRAAWSHDRGDAIIFDAWDDHWERDESGNLFRYPMRTNQHYILAQSLTGRSRGHTRWQHHVDMVLSGQRSAIAIMPIRSGSKNPNRRTRGWLPQYVTGEIHDEGDGEFWFHADEVIPI